MTFVQRDKIATVIGNRQGELGQAVGDEKTLMPETVRFKLLDETAVDVDVDRLRRRHEESERAQVQFFENPFGDALVLKAEVEREVGRRGAVA